MKEPLEPFLPESCVEARLEIDVIVWICSTQPTLKLSTLKAFFEDDLKTTIALHLQLASPAGTLFLHQLALAYHHEKKGDLGATLGVLPFNILWLISIFCQMRTMVLEDLPTLKPQKAMAQSCG